eukprot:4756976-Amphidinium_carterae.1
MSCSTKWSTSCHSPLHIGRFAGYSPTSDVVHLTEEVIWMSEFSAEHVLEGFKLAGTLQMVSIVLRTGPGVTGVLVPIYSFNNANWETPHTFTYCTLASSSNVRGE